MITPALALNRQVVATNLALWSGLVMGGFIIARPLLPSVPGAGTPTSLVAAPAVAPTGLAFTPRSLATVIRSAELSPAPGGGGETLSLAPGQQLAVGGTVHVRAGLVRRTIYWVRTEGPGGAHYGFVPADQLALTTPGEPPILQMAGLPATAFLHPTDGVQGNADGLGAGTTTTDDSSLAALSMSSQPPATDGLTISWLPATVSRFAPEFVKAGAAHGVDPDLLAIVTLVESGGHVDAVSNSGARGLMQIMPTTAADIAQTCTELPFEAATSIDCGARYLSEQLASFGQLNDPDWQTTVSLAAAAYNGGPGTLQGHLKGRALPDEAVRYQRWVGGMWRERHEAESLTFRAWWDAGGYRLVQKAEASALPVGVAVAQASTR